MNYRRKTIPSLAGQTSAGARLGFGKDEESPLATKQSFFFFIFDATPHDLCTQPCFKLSLLNASTHVYKGASYFKTQHTNDTCMDSLS